ncbi:MAG: glucan biosynthesis protein G [Nibricoccus sp.]
MKRLTLAVLCCLSLAKISAADVPFDFEVLQFRAKTLAAKPYAARPSRVPKELQDLSYDLYREIRFDTNRAWWKREQLPFQLQFFHPGFIYTKTVQVSEVDRGDVRSIDFNPRFFEYNMKARSIGRIPSDMGFTGFRIHYALNNPNYLDELAVFQGASYFRALGQAMRYGMSARGLALNTADPAGEEFPIFEEFWVVKPQPDSKELTMYALMDSPSVTGAYRFIITPGASTVMQVRAAVYQRAGSSVKTFGMAPLTSMFWHGENSPSKEGDLRPEVHDSDGLLLERGSGEWLWRALVNPATVRVTSFNDENPKGFGLIQRDRTFANYEDLEAAYHLRPSTWVEPVGQWGRGAVRLVELPTPDETNDNIVAFWVPEKLPAPGEPIEFEYKLHWFIEGTGGKKPPAGFAVATRIGHSKTHEPDLERFWVDFDSPYLHTRGQDSGIEAIVSAGEGAKLVHQSIQKNIYSGTWRVAFSIKPDGSGKPVELRCFLKREPHILTETWSYLWNP